MRDLVRHDLERARDFAARRNHDLLIQGESPTAPLSSITQSQPIPPDERRPVVGLGVCTGEGALADVTG
jgi:hypothetical protein